MEDASQPLHLSLGHVLLLSVQMVHLFLIPATRHVDACDPVPEDNVTITLFFQQVLMKMITKMIITSLYKTGSSC